MDHYKYGGSIIGLQNLKLPKVFEVTDDTCKPTALLGIYFGRFKDTATLSSQLEISLLDDPVYTPPPSALAHAIVYFCSRGYFMSFCIVLGKQDTDCNGDLIGCLAYVFSLGTKYDAAPLRY